MDLGLNHADGRADKILPTWVQFIHVAQGAHNGSADN
jgi:hypothetical protein